MSWNYRAMKSLDVDGSEILAVHEVYYDKRGRITGWTENAVNLDGFEIPKGGGLLQKKELLSALSMMFNDVAQHPIIERAEVERMEKAAERKRRRAGPSGRDT